MPLTSLQCFYCYRALHEVLSFNGLTDRVYSNRCDNNIKDRLPIFLTNIYLPMPFVSLVRKVPKIFA